MNSTACRACGGSSGDTVLDLGEQPPCDLFPLADDVGPDPVYPLQMWLCDGCGLAQLRADPMLAEEPRGVEPAALGAQATEAVELIGAAGVLEGRSSVAEYGSPHGGSWLGLLARRGVMNVGPSDTADLIIDSFGLMHAADQRSALREREQRLNVGGILLLQFHSLDAILRHGQWNVLRHGHFAYYSTTALDQILTPHGLHATAIWRFDLYGGTYLLAVRRASESSTSFDNDLSETLSNDRAVGVRNPKVLRKLQNEAESHAVSLRNWLLSQQAERRAVLGYGAASRAVSLLVRAGIDRSLLAGIVDASPAKQGRRMPGTDVPIVEPSVLADRSPLSVLLFVPDLLDEVRDAFPEVESGGGRWVDAESPNLEPEASG